MVVLASAAEVDASWYCCRVKSSVLDREASLRSREALPSASVRASAFALSRVAVSGVGEFLRSSRTD